MQRSTDPRRSCDHKKQHRTRAEARAAKRLLKRVERAAFDVYRCRFCGTYHVGHRNVANRSNDQ